ncbi:MAG TPA: hypothetical protein VF624_03650 [Tepidisphaeraceae bacterium]|jgi:hypothetical protein
MDDKNEERNFRLPTWLNDGTNRWRMRIGFHFGKNGRRVEKPFYWSQADDNGGLAPPHVQAEAVEHQQLWRKLKSDWKSLSRSLKRCFPQKDWTMPVWCDDERAKMAAGEAAGIAQAMEMFFTEEEARERQELQQAVTWVMRNGVDKLIAAIRSPSDAPRSLTTFPMPHGNVR